MKGMIINYQKRAERRKDHYEKMVNISVICYPQGANVPPPLIGQEVCLCSILEKRPSSAVTDNRDIS